MQSQFYDDRRSTNVMQKIFYVYKKFKDVMKFHFDQIVKLLAKTQKIFNQNLSNIEKRLNIKNLILYLTNLLNSWDIDKTSNDLQSD